MEAQHAAHVEGVGLGSPWGLRLVSDHEPVEMCGFVFLGFREVFHFLVMDDCWVLKYQSFLLFCF